MHTLIIGKTTCPYCQSPIVVIGDEYGRQTPVETDRYLVIFDGNSPPPNSPNRISAFDIETGSLVYGRRATTKERKSYHRTGRTGLPFAIGAIGHLSRCKEWNGDRFHFDPEAFRFWSWNNGSRMNLLDEDDEELYEFSDDRRKQEEMIYE